MRFSSNPNDIGTKLGPKLVKLISETVVATKLRLLDTEHRARVHSMQTIIDRAGHEVADLYRPIFEQALSEQELPDYIKEQHAKVMSGHHQWQAIAGVAFGASGTPNALATIIGNFLAPGVRFAVAKDPQLAPSPETMASLGAKGTFPLPEVFDLSAGAGYSRDIVQALMDAASAWPDTVTSIELMRRHVITEAEAVTYLRRNGVPANTVPQLLALQHQILSPADLADMTVRGVKTEAEAAIVAAQSGYSAADFHDLALINGEPPGLMQMLEGYRRGFIDQATLQHGIRQSRYRDEWIPLIEKLRYEPMSVADAVNAAVQNHISAAEAAQIADFNGLEPGAVDILLQTAGEPLSRTEMSELVNRGEATEAQFIQAMRESRVKDKYIPLAFALRRKLIPPREIHTALTSGAIDHQTAIRKLEDYGYDAADAEISVKTGSAVKMHQHKENITTAVLAAYEEWLIPRADALRLIEQMGYEKSEAEFAIQGADFRQSARIVSHAVNSVHSHYVSRRITRQTASNDLDALGIPAQNRDYLLKMWDIELSANVKTLSEAQVVKAVHKDLITPADGTARLMAMGYDEIDAGLLLAGA